MFDLYSLLVVIVLLSAGLTFAVVRVFALSSYKTLLDASLNTPGHGLVIFDRRGKIRFINDQAKTFIPKLNEKSFVNGRLEGFVDFFYDHAVDCDPALKNMLTKSAARVPFEGFREVLPWGDDGKSLCMGEMILTKKGAYILILMDLSHHKKNEDEFIELAARNKKLAHAIEKSATGMMISNPNKPGNPVLFANEMFCDQLGLDRQDVLGESVYEVFSKSMFTEDIKFQITSVLHNERAEDVVLHIQQNDKNRWFTFKLKPSTEKDGSVSFLLCILNDVTELKHKEQELMQSQKLDALGQLSAGIAHDFNNILSIVQGYARMGGDAMGGDEKIRGYFKKIFMASERGAKLTKKMLTFSRHKIVDGRVVNIANALHEQNEFLSTLLTATYALDITIDDETMCVDVSEDDLMQILMNLVINARDAMQDGGEIQVSVKAMERKNLPPEVAKKLEAERFVCMSVTDTGCGIEKDILDKIFDPFFTTKEAGKGTGLGLSMVYGLVTQSKGHISISTEIGKGTTFFVYLPRSEKTVSQDVSGNLDDLSSLKFDGFTALVVDDEPELLSILSDVLGGLGIEVITAENGSEALMKQEDHDGKIDLLITDVVMPSLDGVKLAELFTAVRPATPVILMSGYPRNSESSQISIPESSLFISKPVQFDELIGFIYSIFNKEHPEHMQILASSKWQTH